MLRRTRSDETFYLADDTKRQNAGLANDQRRFKGMTRNTLCDFIRIRHGLFPCKHRFCEGQQADPFEPHPPRAGERRAHTLFFELGRLCLQTNRASGLSGYGNSEFAELSGTPRHNKHLDKSNIRCLAYPS